MSTKFYKSKKFWYAIATAISAAVADFGFESDPDTVWKIIALGVSLIFGQAAADFGKEGVKEDKGDGGDG